MPQRDWLQYRVRTEEKKTKTVFSLGYSLSVIIDIPKGVSVNLGKTLFFSIYTWKDLK